MCEAKWEKKIERIIFTFYSNTAYGTQTVIHKVKLKKQDYIKQGHGH